MQESFKKALIFCFALSVFLLVVFSVYQNIQRSDKWNKNIEAAKIEDAQTNISDMLNENLALTQKIIEQDKKTAHLENTIKEINTINLSIQNLLFSYQAFQNKDYLNSSEYIKDVDDKVLTDRQKNIYNDLVKMLTDLGYTV